VEKKNNLSSNPLVSVIINCFNGEKYLEECLSSILNQSYKNWEVIFWDNHSTDNSKKIFHEFEDKRFKYFFSSEHTFLYEARDLAIKASNGSLFAFCDVDDYWEKEKLELLVPLFNNDNIGVVYSNQWMLNDNSKKKKKRKKKNLPSGDISSKIISEQPATINTAIIKKSEYFKLEGGFNKNYQIIGDYDFFVRISKNCLFNCSQRPLTFYRLHSDNFTKKNRDIEISELEQWIQEIKRNYYLSKKDINLVNELILYKKIMDLILKNKKFSSISYLLRYPNNLKKIKLLFALIIPISLLEKKKEF